MTVLGLTSTGCKKSSTKPPTPPEWNSNILWPRGTRPVPSPVGDAILFVQEDAPAGLYLYRSGTASLLNPPGVAARTDYAWSHDGTKFCFSTPTLVDSNTGGLWVASAATPNSQQRIWDLGSHPRFYPNLSEGLVCAGPPDNLDSAGIWQFDLTHPTPVQLTTSGVSPEISPDGLKIAYLVPLGRNLNTLRVLDRSSGQTSTLVGDSVAEFDWLGDSQTLVFEFAYFDGAPGISTVGLAGNQTISIPIPGIHPKSLPGGNDYVFTGISGTTNDGLWIATSGQIATKIANSGTYPWPTAANRVIAQDPTGIIELTR
jgi:hypothetical protein